jgi:hypothetical protein
LRQPKHANLGINLAASINPAEPRTFDGVLAWDSFFHLTPDDQRGMFAVFSVHVAKDATLMV